MKVRRALLSVSDKTGIVEFAQGLARLGVELYSTGGTQKALEEAGVPVKSVSQLTGFPEILAGRVKTLHPKVAGGILARRNVPEDLAQLAEHGILPIDLVAVNLYPFAQTIAKSGVTIDEACEQIDIGGPTMVRAAAKNWRHGAVVVNPARYPEILAKLEKGSLDEDLTLALAQEAFSHTASYDMLIAGYLAKQAALCAVSAEALLEYERSRPALQRTPPTGSCHRKQIQNTYPGPSPAAPRQRAFLQQHQRCQWGHLTPCRVRRAYSCGC